MKDALNAQRGWVALALWVATVAVVPGCNSGSSSQLPNISQAAAPLDQDGRSYLGPRLGTSRYDHASAVLPAGQVLICGGSDERHLTSLDTGEVFDQTILDDPQPESISGGWIDTDFNGDPIVMTQGGRVYHTATALPNGNVLVAGGSRDNLISEATAIAEIFDSQSRIFAPDFLEITNEMIEPRFRHTAILQSSGRVLIAGGQISVNETIIDDNFPPGSPLFQVNVETFPSTEILEEFVPGALAFQQVTDLSGNPTTLNTPRGRSNPGSVRVAGVDLNFNTPDDIVVVLGGYQTLSALFAPQTKFPNQLNLDLQQGIEYFDPATGLNASAQNVIANERANDPTLMNLGLFASENIQGIPGVNNVFLVANGDNNGLCRTSNFVDQVYHVTFSGFGPSNGILFGEALPFPAPEVPPGEASPPWPCVSATGIPITWPQHWIDNGACDVTLIPSQLTQASEILTGGAVGRSESGAVIMPTQRTYDGELRQSNWITVAGGAQMTCPMGVQVEDLFVTTIFQMFDPFYNVSNAYAPFDNFASIPPWDQAESRGFGVDGLPGTADDLPLLVFGNNDLAPTGIIGSWLLHDQLVPDNSYDGFFDNSPLVALRFERAYNTLDRIPGQDGIQNTFDDRILVAGGGGSVIQFGGEPVTQSTEIYLPVNANGVAP